MHNSSEINCIEVVVFNSLLYSDTWGYSSQIIIDDNESFLNDFRKVKCYKVVADPQGVEGHRYGIKFTYSNGEFEILSSGGQIKYFNEIGMKYYSGYYAFDENEFNVLISKWGK